MTVRDALNLPRSCALTSARRRFFFPRVVCASARRQCGEALPDLSRIDAGLRGPDLDAAGAHGLRQGERHIATQAHHVLAALSASRLLLIFSGLWQFDEAFQEFEAQLEDFKPKIGEELYNSMLLQVMIQVTLQGLRQKSGKKEVDEFKER